MDGGFTRCPLQAENYIRKFYEQMCTKGLFSVYFSNVYVPAEILDCEFDI